MKREELRDDLLVPVYRWTSLGRQSNKLMVAAGEVIHLRYRRLLWTDARSDVFDWTEVAQMTKEKVVVPMESAVAMSRALTAQTAAFVAQTGGALLACASAATSLVRSDSRQEVAEHTRSLSRALSAIGVTLWQSSGCLAEVASAGLAPLLRQVNENVERLRGR